MIGHTKRGLLCAAALTQVAADGTNSWVKPSPGVPVIPASPQSDFAVADSAQVVSGSENDDRNAEDQTPQPGFGVLDGLHQRLNTPESQNFFSACASAFSMIVISELGDKTFFIAAILSMKHSPGVVFSGAISALAVMTVLASGVGVMLPTMLSASITYWICVVLFFVFGVKLVYDGYTSDGTGAQEEMNEVIEEIGKADRRMEMHQIPGDSGGGVAPDVFGGEHAKDDLPDLEEAASRAAYLQSWHSVLAQSFTMTFVAEWGDRSQIASVALASTNDYIGVTIGGILGHAICTGLAVIGGRMLATSISEKTVCMLGGVLFIFFGAHLLYMGAPTTPEATTALVAQPASAYI